MSQNKIQDAEFDDWLQLEEEDTNWVARQTAQGLPLVLPWKRKAVRLGTCFDSRRLAGLADGVWVHLGLLVGGDRKETETGKHLSLGFGAGVGLPFLCSVSVKGTYDEQLKENKDSDKSSIRASTRCGTVELERKPRLCHEALVMLKYGGGYQAFTQKWGDYFVWGYRLGGDTGIMISSSSFEKKKVEQYGIKATLEVLFVEVSHAWTKDFHAFSAGKKMRMLGYDTLSDKNWGVTMESSLDIENLCSQAEEAIVQSQSLVERSMQILEKYGMTDGDHLTNAQCELLTNNGIAVELVLLPLSSLRDVACWTTESDVI